MLRAGDQPELRLEDDRAGALAADEGAREIESMLGQQFVQVVAGHTARNAREARPNLVRVAIAHGAKRRIDLAAASAAAHDGVELRVGRRSDGQQRPVVEQDLQLFDVVDRLARQQGMGAARVVADHAAQRAAAVRGRIGPERQLVHLGGVPQRVEDDARLHAREPALGIDLEDPVHVLREIEHHGDVAALAGEAGAGAARQDRRVERAARRHRRDHIVRVAGDDEADRDLAVVGAVGRVERAAAAVEADLAADRPLQLQFEAGGLCERIDRFRV